MDQNKKLGTGKIGAAVRIYLISNLDVKNLLRITKKSFKSKFIPAGLQLSFNMQGGDFKMEIMAIDNQRLMKLNYESGFF